MAFFPAEVYASHSGLLESSRGFLLRGRARARLRRRRLLALAPPPLSGRHRVRHRLLCKAPAVVPVLVVAVLCLPQIRQRLVPFLGGVIAGFGIPTLPFFLLAPGAFFRDVIGTPLRQHPQRRIECRLVSRLSDLTGTSALGGGDRVARHRDGSDRGHRDRGVRPPATAARAARVASRSARRRSVRSRSSVPPGTSRTLRRLHGSFPRTAARDRVSAAWLLRGGRASQS